jgi:type II secretory pathway pseudopilin PulG
MPTNIVSEEVHRKRRSRFWSRLFHFQFTLRQLLIAVLIFGNLLGLGVAAYVHGTRAWKTYRARADALEVRAALEAYRVWTGAYPSSTLPPKIDANELLPFYLSAPGFRQCLDLTKCRHGDTDGDGQEELYPLQGGAFIYATQQNTLGRHVAYTLVSPGLDGLAGGIINEEGAFVSDGSDANGDGVPDSADNVVLGPVD